MLSTSLVAVPAFIRVDPVMTSGPTSGTILIAAATDSAAVGLHVKKIVGQPLLRSVLHSTDNERGYAAGGNAHEHVVRPLSPRWANSLGAASRSVLCAFYGLAQGRWSSGD